MKRLRSKFKRTVTTIESHEIFTVKASVRMLCPDCEDTPQMLTLSEAAWQANVGQRAVYQWIEAGLIHFAETSDRGLFVCLAPLDRDRIEAPGCS